MNIRRYIDYAVKREIRRVFHRDSLSDLIGKLFKLCNENPAELGHVRPSLKVLNNIVENPKNYSLVDMQKNKVHFAKKIIQGLARVSANTIKNKLAQKLAKDIFNTVKNEHVTTGSEFTTSSERPYRTVAQQSLGKFIPGENNGLYYGQKLTQSEIQNAREISQRTRIPFEEVLKQVIMNKKG